jgi:hypothetical protein
MNLNTISLPWEEPANIGLYSILSWMGDRSTSTFPQLNIVPNQYSMRLFQQNFWKH